MEVSTQSLVKINYDDGGGNTADYFVKLLGSTDPVLTIAESQWYRPKLMGVIAPLTTVTLTSYLRQTVVGSPPATIDITVGTNGKFGTLPGSASVIEYILVEITIDEITNDLSIYDGDQTIFYPQLSPMKTEIKVDAVSIVKLAYDETLGNTLEVDVQIDEVSGNLEFWYCEGTFPISTFVVGDLGFMLGAATLFSRDFTLGRGIEQSIQVLLAATGIQSGKFGAIVGSVSEYLQDGQFGDLDLPLEIMTYKVKA